MERKADSGSIDDLPESEWNELSSLKGYLVFSALCALYFCHNLTLSWTLLNAPAIISQVFFFPFHLPSNRIENTKENSPLSDSSSP